MKKLFFVFIPLAVFLLASFQSTIHKVQAQRSVPKASDTITIFKDVELTGRGAEMAYFLKKRGVLKGYPDGNLKLDQHINRAEFTKVILESRKDIKIYYDQNFSFPDVAEKEWFAPYVSTAKRLKIVSGYPDGFFRPADQISYVESFKIIVNAVGLKEGSYKREYLISNASQDAWYYPFVKVIESQNVYGEYPDDSNYFGQPIQRGEAFEMLYRSTVVKEAEGEYFVPPYIKFGNRDGFIFIHPSPGSDFKVPMVYQNVGDTVKVSLYSVPEDVFIAGVSSLDRYNPDWLDSKRINQMNFISTDDVEIEELSSKLPLPEYQDQDLTMKRGYISLALDKPGLYFFVLENEYMLPQHLFMNVSRNMILNQSGKKNGLLYIADYETSQPRQNVKLSFYKVNPDETVSSIDSQTTDQNGFFMGDVLPISYIVAHDGDDISVLHNNFYSYYTNSEYKEYRSFVYTDRPVYRPGDTVYYKGILRIKNQNNYDSLPQGQVQVKITTYGSNGEMTIFDETKDISVSSSVSGSFNLNKEDPTGSYTIEIRNVDEYLGSAQFHVQAYKKNEYSLSVTTDKQDYVALDTVNVEVKGSYFFGQPVSNQKVTYVVYRDRYRYYYDYDQDFPEEVGTFYEIDDSSRRSYFSGDEEIIRADGMLDASGLLRFQFPVSYSDSEKDKYQYTHNLTYRIEISSVDASNIPVVSSKTITAYPSSFEFSVQSVTDHAQAKSKYSLEISTTDHSEKIYPEAAFSVIVQKAKITESPVYFDHFISEYVRNYSVASEYEAVDSFDGLVTDQKGTYIFTYTPSQAGLYRFVITGLDSNSREVQKIHSVQVNEKDFDEEYSYNNRDMLKIELDKEVYHVGAKARVFVNSLDQGKKAVWTLSQEDIVSYELKQLNSEATLSEFELLITSEMLQGVLLSVNLPHNYTFFTHSLNLKVLPEEKKLDIDIVPKKTIYKPQETSEFVVTIKDYQGNPVSGDISFALVDKAIYDILAYNSESNILSFYYPQRSYYLSRASSQVTRNNIYSSRYYRGYTKYDDRFEDDAGVEEMMSVEDAAGPPAEESESLAQSEFKSEEPADSTRKEFLDTAYFLASAQTNSQGQAVISAKLPDNLTTWVGSVIAATSDTKVGQGNGEITVQKDFIISPHVPRFALKGDQMTLRATVRNYNAPSNDFTVTLSGTGFETENTEQKITIAKGKNSLISWPITVTDSAEMVLSMAMKLNDSNKNDTVELKIPVNIFGDEVVNSHIGEDQGEVSITPQSGKVGNIRSLLVMLSPTLADNLIKSIEYLVGFPYGCVEQTMSKFLPNVVVYGAKDKLKFSKTDIFKELPEQVESGLKRLYAFQHGDGGWGWWEQDPTHPKNTAYVVYGLILAQKAGFAVDQQVIDRGVSMIVRYLNGDFPDGAQVKELPLTFQAYLNYVHALAIGKIHHSFATLEQKQDLKVIDRAYMALTYELVGDTAQAMLQIETIKPLAKTHGDGAYWPETTEDYEFMNSDQLTTAVALEALVTLSPNDSLVPKVIRYINKNSGDGMYHETHATAHAVIALTEYLNRAAEAGATPGYALSLNGKVIQQGTLDKFQKFEIDLKQLTGNDLVTISKTGSGKLYYSVVSREFIDKDSIEAFSSGFGLKRTYLAEDGKPLSGELAVGTVVKVALELANQDQQGRYMIIKDNLPAGFEPINPELAGGSSYSKWNSGGDWVSHRDYLDDHVALFVDYLSTGKHTYYYYARAVTPGTFKVNPAKAEMMYAPEVSGGSGSTVLTIK